jgi:hypothetical protein
LVGIMPFRLSSLSFHLFLSSEAKGEGEVDLEGELELFEADLAHEEQPHGDLAHEEQPHGDLAHEEQPHGDLTHEEQPHGDLTHEEQPHGDLAHEEQPHGDLAHEEQPHGDLAHGEDPEVRLIIRCAIQKHELSKPCAANSFSIK